MKRLVSILLTVLTVISAIPLTASADDCLPFKDVKGSHWFYDAVKYTYEKGIFAANNAAGDMFAPNTTMTRAMFVTVLFRLSGADQSAYTGKTVFTDVPENQWYAKGVQWANEKGYVAGMTATTFAPNGKITRAQMARILALYAAGEDNYDLTDVRASAFDKFADASKVQAWAKEGITWMSSTGLINGMGTEKGAPILNPNGNATRAQAAQILMSYMELRYNADYPIGEVYIGENNLRDYTIVYGVTGTKGESYSASEAASELHKYVKKATGLDLPVKADTDPRENEENDKEILIGKTNREDNGTVNIDRASLEKGSDALIIEVQGNYLILASSEEYQGTYNAVYEFCENYLGYEFLVTLEIITPKNVVQIPSDLKYTEAPTMQFRMNYNSRYDQTAQLRNQEDSYYSFANLMHTLPEFAISPEEYGTGSGIHNDYYLTNDPCLTRPDIQANIVANVITRIKNKPNNNMVWVCQSDRDYYCNGRNAQDIKNGCVCGDFYRQHGRCSTYVNILDIVADAVLEASKEEGWESLADYYIVGMVYKYTCVAPKNTESWDLSDNIIMCICTDNACSAHAITDPSCKNGSNSNVEFYSVYKAYAQLCPNLFVWDYINGNYSDLPYPVIHQIYENFKLYNDTGVWGTYVMGDCTHNASFPELKTYLISKLQWQTDMTETEYWNHVDTFLKGFYGDGWTYIREYIEVTHDLAAENEWHIWSKNRWDEVITYEQYLENYDYLRSLWDKAEELANTDTEKLNVRRGALQMRYVEVCMAYRKYAASGKEADFEAFKAINLEYADYMSTLGHHQFSLPSNWTVDGNPDLWDDDSE